MTARTIDLQLTGMTCAACAARIEKVLNRAPGVRAAVNFATETAHVEYEPDKATPAEPDRGGPQGGLRCRAGGRPVRAARARGAGRGAPLPARTSRLFALAALLTAPLVAQMVFMVNGRHEIMMPVWLQFALATPVQFWAGARFYRGAWNAVRGGAANMDVLVALGTTAAYLYSIAVWLVPLAEPARVLRGGGRRDHARAARQAARGTGEGEDGQRDPAPARAAAADRAARARRRREGGPALARARGRRLRRPRRRERPGRRPRADRRVGRQRIDADRREPAGREERPAIRCSPAR